MELGPVQRMCTTGFSALPFSYNCTNMFRRLLMATEL